MVGRDEDLERLATSKVDASDVATLPRARGARVERVGRVDANDANDTNDINDRTLVEPHAPTHEITSPSGASGANATAQRTAVDSTGASTARTVAETVVSAMHEEEAARARAFGRSISALAIFGMLGQPLFWGGTAPWLFWTNVVNLVVLLVVGVWAYRRAQDPKRYDVTFSRAFACIAAVAGVVLEYYAGVFSPGPIGITLGIAFFGMGHDERFAIGLSGLMAGSYFAVAMGVAFKLIPDFSLFRDSPATLGAKVFMAFIVPIVYLVTLWQARLNRRATREAMERSNEAMRLASQREAQLLEARGQVEAALRAGAGQRGLYSGRTAGDFELDELIGRGAMGEVYAATHMTNGARAAVKVLSAAALANPELRERFLREGEIATRIHSPNVVRVIEVGEITGWAPYIAMELLKGDDLAHHLRRRGQLDVEDVLRLVRDVAIGLEAAHAASVVHRDLKPQNLVLDHGDDDDRGTWKILDFGVSRLLDSNGTLTQHGVIGTPGYMAPEQARGAASDHRADLFSLASVIYRCLTGRPPFQAEEAPRMLLDIVYGMPMKPSEIVPSIPHDVELVLAIGFAKKPSARFASAREMAEALRLAAAGQLPQALRQRAATLLHRLPWGARGGPSDTASAG
jgi:serine/threonine-protein kinase